MCASRGIGVLSPALISRGFWITLESSRPNQAALAELGSANRLDLQ